MDIALLAVNLLLIASNLYLLLRARARVRALRRTAEDFTRRLLSGHVLVLNPDTGVTGRLVVAPAGDDMLALYIQPDEPDPPSVH
jgi:hypothetical protein